MPKLLLCLLAMLLAGCGKESEKGFASLMLNVSPEGAELANAENLLVIQGLRFRHTSPSTVVFDAAYERQVEWERPFLYHSTRVFALKEYSLAAHALVAKFGTNVDNSIRLRDTLCQQKLIAIQALMAERGASSPQDSALEDATEILRLEEGLARRGIRFEVNIGAGRLTIQAAPLNSYVARNRAEIPRLRTSIEEYITTATRYLTKHGPDLASDLVPKKIAALRDVLRAL